MQPVYRLVAPVHDGHPTVTQDQLMAIARDAGVLPLMVRHQIENHRLATTVE